eukprot:1150889-Pelagomonas_calceolata.AAC.5
MPPAAMQPHPCCYCCCCPEMPETRRRLEGKAEHHCFALGAALWPCLPAPCFQLYHHHCPPCP